jgi:pimeloyl-ACP methyl ester carboxylesterase
VVSRSDAGRAPRRPERLPLRPDPGLGHGTEQGVGVRLHDGRQRRHGPGLPPAPAPFADDFDPTPARVQAHYSTNSHFLAPDHVLVNADRLTMPVHLVQGRYDMVCPPVSAHESVQRLPCGELVRAVSGHGPNRESWNLLRTLLEPAQ